MGQGRVARVTLDRVDPFLHYYPSVVAMVTTADGDRRNVMAAAWHAPLSFDPPLYGVAVSPRRFSQQLLERSGVFGIGFVPAEAAEVIRATGSASGEGDDKFQQYGIPWYPGSKIPVPLLAQAYASYECRVWSVFPTGDHLWYVGEIVAVHVEDGAFHQDGTLRLDRLSVPLYLGRGKFLRVGQGGVAALDL